MLFFVFANLQWHVSACIFFVHVRRTPAKADSLRKHPPPMPVLVSESDIGNKWRVFSSFMYSAHLRRQNHCANTRRLCQLFVSESDIGHKWRAFSSFMCSARLRRQIHCANTRRLCQLFVSESDIGNKWCVFSSFMCSAHLRRQIHCANTRRLCLFW